MIFTTHFFTVKSTMSNTTYYLPAEWQLHSGTQLTWPHEGTDWAPYLDEITDTFINLASAITHHELLVVAAQHAHEVRALLNARLDATLASRIMVYECPNDDTWARDHAFISLIDRNNPVNKAHLLDFKFNGWGEKFAADNDTKISRRLLDLHAFLGEYRDENAFVLEGGAIESDGQGTVMTTSQCLLAPHRNQPMTRDEIEEKLKSTLGAERIIWLDHGNLVGDDTDGHIDTIARFAPDDTILYVGCDDTTDEQYADFAALEAQLHTLRTIDGRPYRLLRLPMPKPIYYDGERLPATYANFYVVNYAVIVPTYGQPENDRRALDIVAEAFPGREVVGVDAQVIIRQHGSIHCLTMQYPEGVMMYPGMNAVK